MDSGLFERREISQEQFFDLRIKKDGTQEIITVKELFVRLGLGRLAEEGLKLERRIQFFRHHETGKIVHFLETEKDPSMEIRIDVDQSGGQRTSEVAQRETMADLVSSWTLHLSPQENLITLFNLHYHPGGALIPSQEDVQTLLRERVPEVIVTPSGQARIFGIKNRIGLQRLTARPLFFDGIWDDKFRQAATAKYLYAFDLSLPFRSGGDGALTPVPSQRSEVRSFRHSETRLAAQGRDEAKNPRDPLATQAFCSPRRGSGLQDDGPLPRAEVRSKSREPSQNRH